jgi:hypothetical protein
MPTIGEQSSCVTPEVYTQHPGSVLTRTRKGYGVSGCGHGVCQRTLTAPVQHPSTALHCLSDRTRAPVCTTAPPIMVESTKGLDNDYADSTSGKCAWKHEIKVSYDTSTLDPIYSSFLSGYHDPNLANGIACQQERSRASCHNRGLVRSPGFHTLMRNEQLLLWCFGSRRYRWNF